MKIKLTRLTFKQNELLTKRVLSKQKADIDYQKQYSPSEWSKRMSADEIVPAHVEQVCPK